MRRHHLIASLVLSVALIGCTDLLNEDPKGFTTTDTFYKTGADLNSATVAIYNALRGIQGQANWTTPELASDQSRADNREPNFNTKSPDFIAWDAATGLTGGYWNTMYSIITRANLVLSKGPAIETPNAQTKAYNLAEATFLRAYAYLWLTKVYDGVPLLLSPEEQANPRPVRTPVEEVHQAIIQDLTEAEAELPATWPGTDGYGNPTQGRVTKGAAQMALADLYLWRSTYMLKNEWRQASDAAKRVIDSGLWSLNADYLRAFRPSNKGNREMIFVIANSGVNSRTGTIFQLFYYPRDWGLDRGQGGGWGLIHPTDCSSTATGRATTAAEQTRDTRRRQPTCGEAAAPAASVPHTGTRSTASRSSVMIPSRTALCSTSTRRATMERTGTSATSIRRCTATPRRSCSTP